MGNRSAAFAAGCLETAWGVLRRDRGVYALVGVYALLCFWALAASGLDGFASLRQYLAVWPFVFLFVFPVLLFLCLVLVIVHRLPKRRGLAFRRVFSAKRVGHALGGAVLICALMVFQGSFTGIKNALPVWNGGFPCDALLAEFDRWLHLGRDPARILAPITGHPLLVMAIEWNYEQAWFVLCFGTLFCMAVLPQAASVRTRYLLTYCVVWIVVGNVLAGFLLSAGPAFYGEVTGDAGRFGDLFASRQGEAAYRYSASGLQAYLWQLHCAKLNGLGSGISAFPSMHVALATLNALFLREWRPRLGGLGLAYAGFVGLSAVLLGWHYAVDAYAGAGAAAVLYLLVRRLADTGAALPAGQKTALLPATAS